MPGFFICESRAASKFLIGIALLDTRFLKNENGENFVGAAGAFVTNDELATLRLDPEGIRVSPHTERFTFPMSMDHIRFTASTSFANPAVTLARSMSDTFAGIRPTDAPAFILAQFGGAFFATALFRWLVPSLPKEARAVLVPHERR
jgi:glycerol uptake facilitator-like aquaporin